MRINISEEKGTPEWYALQAIEAMDIPKRKAVSRCMSAIFAGLGAALNGQPTQAEELIKEGRNYFEIWAAAARQHCDSMNGYHKTVQEISPPPITVDEPEDFDLGEDDL